MSFPNNRGLTGTETTKMKALPAAAATNYSDSIDLGFDPSTHGNSIDGFLQVYLPATPSLADTKTVTLSIEDSADNSSFAAATGTPTFVATGASAAGAAALTGEVQIPTTLRRYVRLKQVVASVGGDNTAIKSRFALIYKGAVA